MINGLEVVALGPGAVLFTASFSQDPEKQKEQIQDFMENLSRYTNYALSLIFKELYKKNK